MNLQDFNYRDFFSTPELALIGIKPIEVRALNSDIDVIIFDKTAMKEKIGGFYSISQIDEVHKFGILGSRE